MSQSKLKDLFPYVREAALIDHIKTHHPAEQEVLLQNSRAISRQKFKFCQNWDMEQTHYLVHFPEAIDWDHCQDQDMEWTFALNRLRFYLDLGQSYVLSQDPKEKQWMLQTFEKQTLDWIKNNPLTEAKRKTSWRSIEAGLRAGYLIHSYSYFYDQLSDNWFEQMKECLQVHADYLMSVDSTFSRLSNWGILEAQGLFKIGLALEDPELIEQAKTRLQQRIIYQVNDDGLLWEQSPMYHNEVLAVLLECLYLAQGYAIEFRSDFVNTVRQMAYANYYQKKPDHKEFLQGDSDGYDLRDHITLAGIVFDDPILKSGGFARVDRNTAFYCGYLAVSRYEQRPAQPLKIKSAFLYDSGEFYLRSDWTETANLLHFTNSNIGTGHGHSDKLHIDLVLGGRDILVDSGRFTYKEEPIRYQLKSAAAHNTMMINETDFSEITGSWSYQKLATSIKHFYHKKDNIELVQGGHLGYIDQGLYLNRKIIYLQPDIYIISDQVRGKQPARIRTSFHFHPAEQVSQNQRGFYSRRLENKDLAKPSGVNDVSGRAMFQLLNQAAVKVSIQTGQYSEFYNQKVLHSVVRLEAELNQETGLYFQTMVVGLERDEPIRIENLPILDKTRFTDSCEAFRIAYKDQSYIIYLAHQEVWSSCNLYSVAGYYVKGRVTVVNEQTQKTYFME